MDRMMAGAPAPGVGRRRPFDPSTVPPEVMARLEAGESVPGPDGIYHPDGTVEEAAPDAAMGAGAPADPLMAGAPAPAVGGAGDGDGLMITEDPAEARNPLAGPMFRNFRQTAGAGFPGAAGGIGGPPAGGNPLLADLPAPAVVEPRIVQSNPNPIGDRGASMSKVGPNLGGDDQPGRQIRYGRRVYTRRQTPDRTMPRSGPFRRPAPDNSPTH